MAGSRPHRADAAVDNALADGVPCGVAFIGNVVHYANIGFCSRQRKRITELLRDRAANNRAALWAAPHAFHLGSTPLQLLIDPHIAGITDNAFTTLAPPVLGLAGYGGAR